VAASSSWAFPKALRPKRDQLSFDLDTALNAMVSLSARIPDEAYTAGLLGTERHGYGCVIGDDGLVLTIGYVITEAQTIWITNHMGQTVPGHALAIDFTSGLGLVLPAMSLNTAPLPRGRAADVAIGDELLVIGHGGVGHALTTQLVARQTFTGYWEYMLDDAIYTAPAHPQWGGTAVVDAQGRIVGVGSLMVQQITEGSEESKDNEGTRVNMSVPVELLEPVLDDLRHHGRPNRPSRPWLGFFVQEHQGRLVVAGLATKGPAARAGIEQGDTIDAVGGQHVDTLADLFRAVWATGPAGTTITLDVQRDDKPHRVQVPSIDRDTILWRPQNLN
jgi:S1-C subfamily serine protease